MELPSQKLIKEVLGKEAIMIQYDEVNSFLIDTLKGFYVVNIYELMHLMKEWAHDKHGYSISSGIGEIGGRMCSLAKDMRAKYSTRENTEFEAVTKACEWILKEQK